MKATTVSLGLAAALVAVSASISHFKFLPVQAQSSSGVSGSPPPPGMTPPAMPQSASAGLWRVDHNFEASIHIKNLMRAKAVEVTPVLFMADGTEYDLTPVNLAPTAVANVGVNQALREAPAYVVSHLSAYGSAALKYAYQAPGVVGGQLMMVDAPRSLVFTDGFAIMGAMAGAMPTTQTQEAVWWKHDPDVGGFLSLTNTTTASVELGLQVVGARGLRLPKEFITLAPHAARMLDLAVLTGGLPGLENQEGGIRIQYEGMMADVIAVGGVENDSEGYSADMPIWPHNFASPDNKEPDSPSQAEQAGAANSSRLTLGGVGIMTGNPDPRMGFPRGTRFTPYVTLRNTTPKPLALAPALWLATPQPKTFSLPAEALGPYETRQVDMAERLSKLGLGDFNGYINLTYSYVGRQGDLMMAPGSVDETGNYVFQVLAQGIGSSLAKDVLGWTVANGYDTMFTLWNHSNTAEDLTATFYFPDGSGQYQLPVHLEARASLNIDVAQLIALNRPDAKGRSFPAGISGGSVEFASPRGVKTSIELSVSAAEFNVENATCSSCCTTCGGVTSCTVSLSPVYVMPNQSVQLYATEYWNNGTSADITTEASWSSSNTSIGTVGNTVSKGLVTGVAGGTASITALMTVTAANLNCTSNGYCTSTSSQSVSGTLNVSFISAVDHTYPNSPLPTGCYVGTPFNAVIDVATGKTHNALDLKTTNIAIGTPVYAAEAGTIDAEQHGIAHDTNSDVYKPGTTIPKCAGLGDSADYVEIKSSVDQVKTKYYHVTICCSLAVNSPVTAGQQIGTVDTSGCSSAPHLHMQRNHNGLVNFAVTGCVINKFDLSSYWYDDGPFPL